MSIGIVLGAVVAYIVGFDAICRVIDRRNRWPGHTEPKARNWNGPA